MAVETRDQLESSRARHAHESASYRRSMIKLHNRLRLLENAIRNHAEGKCSCKQGPYPGSADECLMELYRRVPRHPRKKVGR